MNIKETDFKLELKIVEDYVETINFMMEPMTKLKNDVAFFYKKIELNNLDYNYINVESIYDFIDDEYKERFNQIKSIITINNYLDYFSIKFPNNKSKYVNTLINQILEVNNGMISTRMIEPLNISRWYLYHLEKNNKIERISRGIYVASNRCEDSFYAFQYKYKKTIFSHMNALYFYNMTEEIPYIYTVTVTKKYNVKTVSEKCNIFYVDDDIYELGVCEVKTPSGNKIRTYDLERCICDIIRSKSRMDSEQVKKSVKQYVQRKDKNIGRLSEYSRKMGISEQVLEYVGLFYE